MKRRLTREARKAPRQTGWPARQRPRKAATQSRRFVPLACQELGEIPLPEAEEFLDDFSTRRDGWLTAVEIVQPDGTRRMAARNLPLGGVSFDLGEQTTSLLLGKAPADHVRHTISLTTKITLKTEAQLEIEAAEGARTIVRCRRPGSEKAAMEKRRKRTVHELLRQMPYGLYAVCVRGRDGDFNALMVSWLTQCSFVPPLLLIAVRKQSRSYDLLKKGKAFSVNLIGKDERKLARELVKPADRVGNKLAKVAHFEETTGAPILRKAFAYVECRVREIHEPGDHAIIIGEIVNGGGEARSNPLMCSDVRWHYGG